MNNELERIWKEVVMAWFKVLFKHLPGETEENHDSWYQGLDLNPGALEYETGC
jgi:hypothetical protein